MNFKKYTIKDFVSDKYFVEWVLNPSQESKDFWEKWIKNNPGKAKTIFKAREILLNMTFEDYLISESEIEMLWNRIEERAFSEKEKKAVIPHRYLLPDEPITKRKKLNWQVAATVSILILLSAFLAYQFVQKNYLPSEISTNYGEIKTVKLSDGSTVNLNANSTIRFKEKWQEKEVREVWLEGEAYFDVVHTQSDALFKVMVDGLEVNVLGTEFGVYARGKLTKVVLEEGKVQLTSTESDQKMELAPGDLVTFNNNKLSLDKSKVDTKLYTSWKDRKLHFQSTTLEELRTIMKENYNLDFIFVNADLAHEEFTGVIPTNDIDLLINSLSEAFDIRIEKKGDSLILRRRIEK